MSLKKIISAVLERSSFVRTFLIAMTLIMGTLWVFDKDGNYEPFTVLFGALAALLELLKKKKSESIATITPTFSTNVIKAIYFADDSDTWISVLLQITNTSDDPINLTSFKIDCISLAAKDKDTDWVLPVASKFKIPELLTDLENHAEFINLSSHETMNSAFSVTLPLNHFQNSPLHKIKVIAIVNGVDQEIAQSFNISEMRP